MTEWKEEKMKSICLNGEWKIRWSDGLRGGMPHFLWEDGVPIDADLLGTPHDISDQYDESRWLDARVPGEVHLDLMREGLIGDVYTDINALSCRWVEESLWFYRTTFCGGESAKAAFSCLRFEALEYGAIVYLNGKEIARHANAFYPLTVDVSGQILPGENVLVVRLESGMYQVAEKPVSHIYTACRSVDYLLHKRMYMRKPQSSCGWDWSPRLQNIGIGGTVTLQYSDAAVVDMVSLRSNTADDLQSAWLEARMFFSAWDRCSDDYRMEMTVDGQTVRTGACSINDGVLSLAITIDHPRLWQPRGYGCQELYSAEIALFRGETEIYRTVRETGFRRVEIDQSACAQGGNNFHIVVNGRKVFARGANFVPLDIIPSALTRERYDAVTDLAVEANFNFLRVWGGGVYETDDFFQMCDRKGILTWQEFIAACATVPYTDADLQSDIEREFVYQLRRLSAYPSLIVWCGNNEMDSMSVRRSIGRMPEDAALYHIHLPMLVRREDPEKYYQPCSPWSFDGSDGGSDTVGDQHPWSVGFRDKDHRKYRDMECRFANEGGVLGTTSLKTICQCLTQEKDRHLHSFAWDFHDNMLESFQSDTSNDSTISFWTQKQATNLSLEELVYLSGFLQGEGLREYIDSFRRKKYLCNAAIFWMFNDCWPAANSWSIVDYYGCPKPAYYAFRRGAKPFLASVTKKDGRLLVYGCNDSLKPVSGTGTLSLYDFAADETVLEKPFSFQVAANASQEVLSCDFGEWEAMLTDTRAILCDVESNAGKDRAHLVTDRYLSWKQPFGSVEVLEETPDSVTVRAGGFTPFAILDRTDLLDDNCFLLKKGEVRTLKRCGLPR